MNYVYLIGTFYDDFSDMGFSLERIELKKKQALKTFKAYIKADKKSQWVILKIKPQTQVYEYTRENVFRIYNPYFQTIDKGD
jgi:hypothetical protein